MELSKESEIKAPQKRLPELYSIDTIYRMYINFFVLNISLEDILQIPIIYETFKHAQKSMTKHAMKCLLSVEHKRLSDTYNAHILGIAGKIIDTPTDIKENEPPFVKPTIVLSEEEQKENNRYAFKQYYASRKRKNFDSAIENDELTEEEIDNLQWVLYPKKNARESIYYEIIHPIDNPQLIMHRCKKCGKILKSQSAMLYHAHSHIENFVYKYECTTPDCNFKTDGLSSIQRHVRTCSKSDVFMCNDTSVNKSIWFK